RGVCSWSWQVAHVDPRGKERSTRGGGYGLASGTARGIGTPSPTAETWRGRYRQFSGDRCAAWEESEKAGCQRARYLIKPVVRVKAGTSGPAADGLLTDHPVKYSRGPYESYSEVRRQNLCRPIHQGFDTAVDIR